jgi:tetratricopeptide (TPR) repeat protein
MREQKQYSFESWFRSGWLAHAILVLALLSGCSTTPQEREATYLKRGKRDAAARDYRRAVIEFEIASQNMPKDPEPLYLLGMAYVEAGGGRQALEAFQKVLAVDPKHEGAQYQLALFKLGTNKPEIIAEAKQAISRWIADHPNDADAIASLGLAEAKLGNKPEAIRLLESAGKKNSGSLRVAGTAVAVYVLKGDIDSAKEVARTLSTDLPNSPDAAFLRAQVSLAMNDLTDADAQISHALSLKRDFQPALLLRLRREIAAGETAKAEETTREISRLGQKDLWGAYGTLLFAENKVEQGIAEYQRAMKEHSDDLKLRDEYAAQLQSKGRRTEAETVLAGTLAKSPKDADALLVRAAIEIDGGNLEAAAKDLKTLEGMKVSSPQESFQKARLFAARGDKVGEGENLTEALRLDPGFLKARIQISRVLISSGKPRDALTMLNEAPEAQKRFGEYIYARNMALMAAGNWDEARKGVDAGLKVEPSSAPFLYQDGFVRLQNRDLAGARKSLETSFQLAPGDTATLDLLGSVMRRQGEFPKYVEMVKEAAARNGKSAVLQYATGVLLAQQGDPAGARTAFEAAKADGDTVNADIEIAALDMRAGSLDQARGRLINLVKEHDNARAWIALAEIEMRRGSGEEPVQDYLKAIQREPGNLLAMNNLAGYLATKQKKYDDALLWGQKALAMAPESPIAEDTVGWTYYLEGRYDLALPYLQKSAKGLDRPLAHYHLAAAFLKAGDPARGRKEYESAVKADPKSPERSLVGPLFEAAKER